MDRRYFSPSDLRWENLATSKWAEPSSDENRVYSFLDYLTLAQYTSHSAVTQDKQNVSVCVSGEKKSLLGNNSAFLSPSTLRDLFHSRDKKDLSIRVTARTERAEREWESQERERWTLSIFNSIFIARRIDSLEAANVFSM